MAKWVTAAVVVAVVAGAAYAARQYGYDRYVPGLPALLGDTGKAGGADGAAQPAGGQQAQGGGSGGGKRGGQGRSVSVAVATAVAGDMPIERTTIGWIASVSQTTITTQQQGIVTKLAAANGQEVKAGDLLVQLDDRTAQATLSRDQAALTRDQAAVTSTQADLKRAQSLVARQVDSTAQLDQATAAAASAEAVVSLDQANISADKVVIDELAVRAPHDGRLGAFQVTVGSLVQPGNPIVTLTDVDNIEANFVLSDADANLLRQNLARGPVKVTVTATAAEGGSGKTAAAPATADGTVDFIDSAIVQGTGTLAVRASVANKNRPFWPGEAVRVTVALGDHPNVVIVPTVAVQQGQNGQIAFVVKDDKTIDVRSLDVAGINGDRAGVLSGLSPGDQVVVEGQLSLAPGMKVEVRDAKASGDAKPNGAAAPADGGQKKSHQKQAASGTAS